METNEIMTNDEVIEATEEIVEKTSGNGMKYAVIIGLSIGVGVLSHKYLVKPLGNKIKSKLEAKKKLNGETVDVGCSENFKVIEVEPKED